MNTLNFDVHGGPDALGVPRHDFSTNANAVGPCPLAAQALQQTDAHTYPDPHYTALRERLARFHGVRPERVLVAGSASEFIHRITAAVTQQGGATVWLPPQHYGDYARASHAWGLSRLDDPTAAALVWACEPSSPLGQAQVGLGPLSALPPGHVWPTLVLDQAYVPLRLSGESRLTGADLTRVWQLWSPNKALGLTGVRAAYVIAPAVDSPAVTALRLRLGALAPSWPLGAHGVALLQAWVTAPVQQWLAQSLATLSTWKARQVALCEHLGWTVLPSQANYFCATVPDADLTGLLARLRHDAGIKLRDCSSFGLPGHVRLGVLPPHAQDALERGVRQTRKFK